MKSFDSLRKRIVKKLIRPEDGYVFMGPITKFYYDNNSKKYLYSSASGYLEPTLTGWKASTGSSGLSEVDFNTWTIGILSNIYAEYSERLENISLKELKGIQDFKRSENGEKIVINRKSFCNIMESLDKYWDTLDNLSDILNVQFESNMLTEIFDSVVEALGEDLEPELYDSESEFYMDKEPLILRWLIEFDAGRNEKAKEGIDGHPLTTAGELYDYLVWKQNFSEENA